jgi:hypothetical protein
MRWAGLHQPVCEDAGLRIGENGRRAATLEAQQLETEFLCFARKADA